MLVQWNVSRLRARENSAVLRTRGEYSSSELEVNKIQIKVVS
jgi:hypothetical protein